MKGTKWMTHRENVLGLTQVIVGIILLALVIGLWVYLWVPPWSAF
jgi:hypothetical protein